ncbi:MAG TPA: helical backbone metal receptor [Bacteroidia bacterium]|nr:helical backbone metal receptor [Bacteroidia bacterium]
MITSTDQLGRTINLPASPERIISLVPSQTELLFDLGVADRIAGITKFCIHPETALTVKPHVGGTKNINLERIRSLQPDLIIGNKEENEITQIDALIREFPVWMSDIKNLDDSMQMIHAVGKLVRKEAESSILVSKIESGFAGLASAKSVRSPQTAYLIWKDPWMAAGSGTFIDAILGWSGLQNIFHHRSRYPETSPEEIASLSPELVFLSSEPYPFREEHIAQLKSILPAAKILLVDGEMFSWYGSRLLLTPEYLKMLLQQIDSPS